MFLSLITVTLSSLFIGFPLPFLGLAKTFSWRSILRSVQHCRPKRPREYLLNRRNGSHGFSLGRRSYLGPRDGMGCEFNTCTATGVSLHPPTPNAARSPVPEDGSDLSEELSRVAAHLSTSPAARPLPSSCISSPCAKPRDEACASTPHQPVPGRQSRWL